MKLHLKMHLGQATKQNKTKKQNKTNPQIPPGARQVMQMGGAG